MKKFPVYKQLNAKDCGPTCLRMIAMFYGRHLNQSEIHLVAGFGKTGVSLLGISEAAEAVGFRTRGVQLQIGQLTGEVNQPCILHWDQTHFVVLVGIQKAFIGNNSLFVVADPAKGLIKYQKTEFLILHRVLTK